jgi:DNA-binding beta-propeller fold protein YncE
MSFIPRTYKLAICATIAAIAGLGQTPNLYLLPNSSSSVALVTNFRTDPLSPLSSFTVQPGVTMLLTHPNGQKLYAIARSGADTLLVLDAANPTNVLRRQNLAQAEAAAISPDGRRLLIVANGLHIFDTTNDTLL